MRLKLLLIVLISFLFNFLESSENKLKFHSLKNTEPIIVTDQIDFDEYEAYCEIEYIYEGDWIGGWSIKKSCTFIYDYLYKCNIIYLDENNKVLYEIIVPDSFKEIHRYPYFPFYMEFGPNFDGNFVFKEELTYSFQIALLSPIVFKFKKLKELIQLKKIRKIKIILENVEVQWSADYTNIENNNDKEIKKGKLNLEINNTFIFDVRYNE